MMETVTRHIIVISFRAGDFIDFIAAVALLLTETFILSSYEITDFQRSRLCSLNANIVSSRNFPNLDKNGSIVNINDIH